MTPSPPPSGALPPAVPIGAVAALFDEMTDTVFFTKDASGRYTTVNHTLVERCGLSSQADLLGRTVDEVFPRELAESYRRQDREVLRQGKELRNRLELHWHRHGRTGWCLTTKLPLRDVQGRIHGIIGISRDLSISTASGRIPPGLARVSEHLEKHHGDGALSPRALARLAGMTPSRFARLVKRIYHLTPGQLITQARIQAASHLLRETSQSVAEVALACGYCDHSAFSRAFHAATGTTPSKFRTAFS